MGDVVHTHTNTHTHTHTHTQIERETESLYHIVPCHNLHSKYFEIVLPLTIHFYVSLWTDSFSLFSLLRMSGLVLPLLFIIEIHVLNTNSADPDQTPRSAASDLVYTVW